MKLLDLGLVSQTLELESFNSKISGSPRPLMVEGIAVATMNTAIFAGQIIASLVIGPVVDAVGDVKYFMIIPCLFATLSFLVTLPVKSKS